MMNALTYRRRASGVLCESLETRTFLSGVSYASPVDEARAAIRAAAHATVPTKAAPSRAPAVAKATAKLAVAKVTKRAHHPQTNTGGTTSSSTTSGSTSVTPAASPPDFFPGSVYYPAGTGNYATGHAGHAVSWVVIHTTESTASSTINEFTTANQQVSANYMVQRNGVIDQFVADSNTAYHCGNLAYNESSIGIEHERYTSGGVDYNATEQEYEASATLVRWLSSYYGIPLQHLAAAVAPANPSSGSDIIGHYQVPDPSNPNLGGGASHHTDPVNWDWTHYVDLLNTTTTPLMPVLVGVGSPTSGATSVNGATQTLTWMTTPNATSYKVTFKDTTANTTFTYTPTGTSQVVSVVAGHAYSWSVISLNGTTQSIASPTYYFTVGTATTITDAQKQSLMLQMVNNYRGSVPADVVLAEIGQEGGQGAFYVNGSTYNSFYSSSIQPWCQPTNNADGIMQVTTASGYSTHRPYATTQQGYDDSINDGAADLKANYASYGTLWQASLHYNTGPNSLYIYENGMGDKQYLAHIATKLSSIAGTLYGISDQPLIDKYNAAQSIVNGFLNNSSILANQSVSYYSSYQTQLDAQLRALLNTAPNTPTNLSPANGATDIALGAKLTASAFSDPDPGDAQAAAEWVVRRSSDGVTVYDSGVDATDLTSLTLPAGALAASTHYIWQVRYQDRGGLWSGYSAATGFTTQPPPFATVTGSALTLDASLAGGPIDLGESNGVITAAAPAGTYTFNATPLTDVLFNGSANDDTLNVNSSLDVPLSFTGNGGNDTLNITGGAVTLKNWS